MIDCRGSFGDYELLELLGKGGMGIVYRAYQASADRTVALKVLRPERLQHTDDTERGSAWTRFRTEAHAAASIEHDNLLPVYHVGEFDGQPFFTMPLVTGESLCTTSVSWATRGARGSSPAGSLRSSSPGRP